MLNIIPKKTNIQFPRYRMITLIALPSWFWDQSDHGSQLV